MRLTAEELRAFEAKSPVLYPDEQMGVLQQRNLKDVFNQSRFDKLAPPFVETGLYFEPHGDSKYDQGTPLDSVFSEHGIGDWRAANQGLGAKWANVAANFGTIATTSFINNTIGGIWGLAEALATGDANRIVNNQIANFTQDIQDAMHEIAPLYRTQWEMEAPWWERLSTANWWGDVVISQGFTAGVISAMALTGGLIGAAQRGLQSYRLSKGMLELGSKGAIKGLAKGVANGTVSLQQAGQAAINAGKMTKGADFWRTVISSIYSSHGYATTEAISHTRGLKQELTQKYDQDFERNRSFIAMEAMNEILAENPMIDQNTLTSLIDERVNAKYESGVEGLEKLLDNKRNLNYGLNLAYLTATNAAAWGSFARGNFPTMKAASQNLIKLKDPAAIKKGVDPKTFSPYQKIAMVGGRVFKNPMVQFAEESALHINREGTADFYRSQFDPEATKKHNNFIEAYTERIWNVMSDPREWESGVKGFLGGMLGGIGPRVRSGKLTKPFLEIKGGIFEAYGAIKDVSKRDVAAKQQAAMVNDILKDDRIREMHLAGIRNAVINGKREQALFLDDKFEFDNQTANDVLNSLFLFDDLGMSDEFIELLSAGDNMSVAEFRKLMEITTDSKGNKLEQAKDPLEGLSDTEVGDYLRNSTKQLKDLAEFVLSQRNNVESLLVHRGLDQYPALRNQLLYYIGSTKNMESRMKELITNNRLEGVQAEYLSTIIDYQEERMKGKDADMEKIFELINRELELRDQINTLDADATHLNSLIGESVGLVSRIHHFKNLYERLITQEGADKFLAELQEAEKQAAQRENSETVTGAEATENKDVVPESLKPLLEETIMTETIVDPDNSNNSVRKTHRGIIAIKVETKDGENTGYFEVQGVTKDGHIELKPVGENEGKPSLFLGEDGFLKRKSNEKNRRYDVLNKAPIIGKDVVKSANDVRQEFHQNLFTQAVRAQRSDLVTTINESTRMLKEAEGVLQKIEQGIKRAEKNKTRTIREAKGETTLKDAFRDYLGEEVNKVITIEQLTALRDNLENLKNNLIQNKQEATALLQNEYRNFVPEEFKETTKFIEDEIETTGNLITRAENLINKINNRIAKLKSTLKGRYTFLKNKLQEIEARNLQDFEDLGLDDVFDGRKVMSQSHLNTAVDLISELSEVKEYNEKIIDNIEQKIEDLEQEKQETLEALQEYKADLNELNHALKERNGYMREYNNLLKSTVFAKSSVAKPSKANAKGLSSNKDETNVVNQIENEGKEVYPQAHIFTGDYSELLVTTSNQIKFSDAPETFESQLKFQRKLDSEDILSGNYKVKLVSRATLLKDYSKHLSENAIRDIESYSEEGVYVVLYKNGEIYTEKSMFVEGKNVLLLSVLHEAKNDKGIWVNEKKTSGQPIVAKDYYDKLKLETPFIEAFYSAYKQFDAIKKEIIENGESDLLSITGVTPGYNLIPGIFSEVADAIREEEAVEALKVHLGTGTTITVGGKDILLESGMVKIERNNRLYNAQRNKLSKESTQEVVGLLQAYFLKKNDEILNSIDHITFLHFESKKEKTVPYKFYIETDKSGNPVKVVFGEKNEEVTKEQLLKGNTRALELFLETKYYNVKKKTLAEKGEFSILKPLVTRDGDGNIANVETDIGRYSSYNQYLFDKNEPKLLLNVVGNETANEVDYYRETAKNGVINKGLEFAYKPVATEDVNPVTNKTGEQKKTTKESIIKEVKVVLDGDYFGAEDLSKAEVEKLQEQKPKPNTTEHFMEDVGIDMKELAAKKEVMVAEHEERLKLEQEEAKKKAEENVEALLEDDTPLGDLLGGKTKNLTTADRNNAIRTSAEQEIALIKEMFPNIDASSKELTVEALMEIKNNKLKVLINPSGVEGRAYHEAFHVIEEIFTPKTELSIIYDDTRSRLGNDIYTVEGKEVVGREMTDAQVSEFLAEEYREYRVLGKENYKFAGKESKLRKFFNWLDRVINKLLSMFNIGYAINTKYADMSKAEALFRQWDNVQKNIPQIINSPDVTKNKIGDLTSDDSVALTNHFNYLFFDVLHNNPEFKDTTLKDLSNTNLLERLYKATRIRFAETIKSNIDNLDSVIHKYDHKKHGADLIKNHYFSLKKYNIRPELADRHDDIETPSQFFESYFINVKDTATTQTKFLIAGLPNVILDSNGKKVIGSNKGLPVNARFESTFGLLHRHLADVTTYGGMVQRLTTLSRKFPVYEVLLERLGSKVGALRQNTTEESENSRVAFFKHFRKSNNDFLQGKLGEEGQMFFINATEFATERLLKERWHNNLRYGYSKAFKRQNNDIVFDPNAKVTIGKTTQPFKDFLFSKDKQPFNNFLKGKHC
jgi:hypothetical protein